MRVSGLSGFACLRATGLAGFAHEADILLMRVVRREPVRQSLEVLCLRRRAGRVHRIDEAHDPADEQTCVRDPESARPEKASDAEPYFCRTFAVLLPYF